MFFRDKIFSFNLCFFFGVDFEIWNSSRVRKFNLGVVWSLNNICIKNMMCLCYFLVIVGRVGSFLRIGVFLERFVGCLVNKLSKIFRI